jgi:glucose/arabinose dehydrogenase
MALPGAAVGQEADEVQAGDQLGEVESLQASFTIEVVATGFTQPFAMAFLPDGRLLVTDRPASAISIVDPATGAVTAVTGLPPIYRSEEEGGGITDLILHPEYESNGWIYFDYAHETDQGITMAVSRARLSGNQLVDHERLLVVSPAIPDNAAHLGSRLAIQDGYLYATMGERYFLRDQAQDISNHNGTVLRIHDDGRVPGDNPFVGLASAMPEIWSYGHRNTQGLAFHPETGDLWLNEHGPKGGDEINIVRPGRNYGWPVITFGMEYDDEGGGPIGEGITEREGMEQPVYYYRPSIGPSDLVFYRNDAFPQWQGDAFIGAMALTHLSRLEVADDRVINEERLLEDRDWRVRSIEEGPDGSLYLGIDGGMIVRLRPLEPHD